MANTDGVSPVKPQKLKRDPAFFNDSPLAKEAIELLQACIQVDTSNPPGNEMVLAVKLKEKFDNEHLDGVTTEIIETVPGRGNLIVTIHGTEDGVPCWGFGAHLDVVPATESDWIHPPFSGALVAAEHDTFVWGRGAMDMKVAVAAHAMAAITMLREGHRPRGTIKLFFEADEERGGEEGFGILVKEHSEKIQCDCFITEGGGFKFPLKDDFLVQVAEKGKCQTRIKVKGVSGHGSMPDPYEQLALYKLVGILERLRKRKTPLFLSKEYKQLVNALSLPGIFKALLKVKSFIPPLLKLASKLLKQDLKKAFMPLITDTVAPTVLKAGHKVNVISPDAELMLDIRTIPGHDQAFIHENVLKKIIGKKLLSEVVLEPVDVVNASTSPIDTPYYEILGEVLDEMYPGANMVPMLGTGGTDCKWTRLAGIPSYGFVLLMKDEDLTYGELLALSHAPNERISVTNLMLATEYAYRLMKRV